MNPWEGLPDELWEPIYEALHFPSTGGAYLMESLSAYASENLMCSANEYPATNTYPAEPCENVALPGSETCRWH